MKKILLVLVFQILGFSFLFTQTAPDTLWTKQLSGKCGNSIVQTENGNFIIAGHNNGSQYFGDVYVLKVDPVGQVIWDNTFNSNNLEDSANSIIKINDNNFLFTGTFNNYPFLTKIDSNGDSLWFRSYTNPEFRSSNSVDIDGDGNFAFCGSCVYGYIVKTDSSGNLTWFEYYPNNMYADQSSCNYIRFISDNNIAIAGLANYHMQPGIYWTEAYLIKTDNLGNQLFYENLDNTSSPEFVYTDNDNYIYIADYHVYKLDAEGNILWQIDLPFYATSIIIDENNYVIAGYNEGNPCVLKINDNGNQLWFSNYETITNDFIYEIIKTNDDGYALVGRSDGHLYLMKLSSEGISNADDLIISDDFNCYNFPNPFNPYTTIEFSIHNESNVELSIFNLKGQRIKTLINESLNIGKHSVNWNGCDNSGKSVSSGVYLYQVKTKSVTITKRMLLLK